MIVVTGVKGFVGGRIAQLYTDQGGLVGIDIQKSGDKKNLKEYLKIDLSSDEAVDKLKDIGDADAIVHCAAIISPEKCQQDPRLAYRTNIMGTLNMLEYARLRDIRKFVYISSGGIYENSESTDVITENWPIVTRGIYSISKIAAENTVEDYSKNYGIDAVGFRITAPYGPGMFNPKVQKIIPDALHRHTLLFALHCATGKAIIMKAGGDHTVNYTYIDDIVKAVKLALIKKIGRFEPFNIAGGMNYRITELGDAVKRICPELKVDIGKGDLLHSTEKQDPMNSMLPIKQGLFDISKAGRILGYKPDYGLVDGMRNLISNFREILGAS